MDAGDFSIAVYLEKKWVCFYCRLDIISFAKNAKECRTIFPGK